MMSISVTIDEDFEVVIMENHLILGLIDAVAGFGNVGPNLMFCLR